MIDTMIEVKLKIPDDFLKIKETLSRIGVSSRKEKKLFQSCHILHKQGKYYIVHFKELFALDGKETNLSENDIARRNTVANLLKEWGLVDVLGNTENVAPLSQIKVLSYREKDEWTLETKYNIGNTKIPNTKKGIDNSIFMNVNIFLNIIFESPFIKSIIFFFKK